MNAQPVHHLFVYGSLRSGFQSHAYEYIRNYFNFVSEGKVKGILADLGEYPAAVPSKEEVFITGELYCLKNADEFGWAFGQLDDYEGVNTEAGETQLYRREQSDIFTANGPVTAWIYWYNGDISGKPMVASGDILQYLADKNK